MDKLSFWLGTLQAFAPVVIAIVTIIPTIIANRKKTGESIQMLQDTLNKHIREDEDEKARNQRYRILRFYDEICSGCKHSENHYEDILDDISDYEKYCAKHADFRNSRGGIAMEEIKETYKRLKNKGSFLQQNKEQI